ncbi:hypothetical protein EV132_104156 [Rhizobium sullae]|uniref:Uncharacterized protein n=2 Tax=Rhizobium sullae TaxID=50338 RepID=A0A4R3Q749_RHISU|nr:hypothetical protein EV132_104156 [Rhizobium sullae]
MPFFRYPRMYVFAAAAVFALTVNGSAADAQASVQQSMADFMKSNPDCKEFNDQCSICAVTDGKAECSTPEIACVKKPYVCTRRADN